MATMTEVSADATTYVNMTLAAKDHYAAIGADRDASREELHKCYIRTSVKVHPDKNSHPDATKAFQRVAAAWAVLGDVAKRRQYDLQLQTGCSRDNDGHISPEDAFATFAFATAACASSGCVGDFAETLFWAQRLAQMRQAQEAQNAYYSQQQAPPAEEQQLAIAMGGLAISAGLFAVGAVASAAGLPVIGRFGRRMAVIQGVSQAVGLAQVPMVQVRCSECAATVSNHTRGLADQLGGMWSSASATAGGKIREISESDTVRNITDGLHSALEATHSALEASGVQSNACLPPRRKREAQLQPPPAVLEVGALVRLQGLQAAGHLNGRIGEILGVIEDSTRHQVRLLPATVQTGALSSGRAHTASQGSADVMEVKLVRRENLEEVFDASSEGPPDSAQSFL